MCSTSLKSRLSVSLSQVSTSHRAKVLLDHQRLPGGHAPLRTRLNTRVLKWAQINSNSAKWRSNMRTISKTHFSGVCEWVSEGGALKDTEWWDLLDVRINVSLCRHYSVIPPPVWCDSGSGGRSWRTGHTGEEVCVCVCVSGGVGRAAETSPRAANPISHQIFAVTIVWCSSPPSALCMASCRREWSHGMHMGFFLRRHSAQLRTRLLSRPDGSPRAGPF